MLFEFRRLGAQVRVAAIHAETLTEVIVVCPARASEPAMRELALAKLRRKLAQSEV